MIARKIYHVTTNGNLGWKSMMENSCRTSVSGISKQDVVNRTIAMAKHHAKCSVVIHKRDGSIEEEKTYPINSYPHTS